MLGVVQCGALVGGGGGFHGWIRQVVVLGAVVWGCRAVRQNTPHHTPPPGNHTLGEALECGLELALVRLKVKRSNEYL